MSEKTLNTRIIIKHDTSQHWNEAIGFIPLKGEFIVYEDYKTELIDGVAKYIPAIKIGDGNAYVQDLPFMGEASIPQEVWDHINNALIHVSEDDRVYWNHKIDCYDDIQNDVLILYR